MTKLRLRKNLGVLEQTLMIIILFLPVLILVILDRKIEVLNLGWLIPVWALIYIIALFVFGFAWSRRKHYLFINVDGNISLESGESKVEIDLKQNHEFSITIHEFMGSTHEPFILPSRLSVCLYIRQESKCLSIEIGTSWRGDSFIKNDASWKIQEYTNQIRNIIDPIKDRISRLSASQKTEQKHRFLRFNAQFTAFDDLENNLGLLELIDCFRNSNEIVKNSNQSTGE
jgi:hypothetical protein